LVYNLNKTPPFFTGRKLRPLGIGIEATVCKGLKPSVYVGLIEAM